MRTERPDYSDEARPAPGTQRIYLDLVIEHGFEGGYCSEVAKAYYAVPPEFVGRSVWVWWDARLVRVFNERLDQIAVHRRDEQGKFGTHGRCRGRR